MNPALPRRPHCGWALLAIALLLAGAALACYSNTFRVPFLLDDRYAIVENPSIRQLAPGVALVPPELGPTGGRPLLNLSFAANYAVGGTAVAGYHVINLLIHVAAALALFGIVHRTRRLAARRNDAGPDDFWFAAVAALLWAMHPLHTEAVTYVSERAESLMGLFYLLTLLAFVRSAEAPQLPGPATVAERRRRRGWAIASVLSCFAGMATKEVMVTAPVVVLLYDRTFLSSSLRAAMTTRWRYYVALAASWLLLAYLMVSSHIAGRTVGPYVHFSRLRYLATELTAIGHYARLALWPSPLVFDYGTEVYVSRLAAALPYAVGIVLVGVCAGVAWRRAKAVAFLIAAFFVLLAPTSSVVPVAYQPIAESRMYLPLAAVVVAATLAAWKWAGRAGLAGLVVLAVLLGGVTYRRNHDYRNAIALWTDTLQKHPQSSRAENCLGLEYARQPQGDAQAVAHFEQALRIRPDYLEANFNLANVLSRLPSAQPGLIFSAQPGFAARAAGATP